MTSYDKNNIFAKILKGDIPAKTVFEDDQILAFYDIAPKTPIHILVIPKRQYTSFDDFCQTASKAEIDHFFRTLRQIAKDAGLHTRGYRLITNHGDEGGQEVPHFHFHILGGKPMGPLVASGG